VLVVTPDAIVSEHVWYAGRSAVPADSVSVAVAVPEPAFATVKVVVPQPLSVTAASVPNWNVGRSKAMVSGVEVSKGELSAKLYEMEDGV
jgi:hypothetical protein